MSFDMMRKISENDINHLIKLIFTISYSFVLNSSLSGFFIVEFLLMKYIESVKYLSLF